MTSNNPQTSLDGIIIIIINNNNNNKRIQIIIGFVLKQIGSYEIQYALCTCFPIPSNRWCRWGCARRRSQIPNPFCNRLLFQLHLLALQGSFHVLSSLLWCCDRCIAICYKTVRKYPIMITQTRKIQKL